MSKPVVQTEHFVEVMAERPTIFGIDQEALTQINTVRMEFCLWVTFTHLIPPSYRTRTWKSWGKEEGLTD